MSRGFWERLNEELSNPILRASPGTQEEIDAAARAIGCVFDGEYVEFLRRYGGAMVGAYPVFGVHQAEAMGAFWSVESVTKWFRSEGWKGAADWYVISIDGSGNPIGISSDGRVWISDHDVGEVRGIAPDFMNFIVQRCLDEGGQRYQPA